MEPSEEEEEDSESATHLMVCQPPRRQYLPGWTCGLCRDESELSHSNLIRIPSEGTDSCSTHLSLLHGVLNWTVRALATSLAASLTGDFSR